MSGSVDVDELQAHGADLEVLRGSVEREIAEASGPLDERKNWVPTLSRYPSTISPGELAVGAIAATILVMKEGSEEESEREERRLRMGWDHPLQNTECGSDYAIPVELLKYEPGPKQRHLYFFEGTTKETAIRQIFLHSDLDELEQKLLARYRDYCKEADYDIPLRMEPFLLRCLMYNYRRYGIDGYLERSRDHMQLMTEWRQKNLPVSYEESQLISDLNLGILYWAGRDFSFRPVLMVRLVRMPKAMTPERFSRLVIFTFEWVLRYMMVPGKAETCLVLADVRNVSVFNFPVTAITDLTTMLTKQYPFRLYKMIVINNSVVIQTMWSIIKQFLSEIQQQKIGFVKGGYEKEICKHISKNQVETSYGGLRREIESYYPFPVSEHCCQKEEIDGSERHPLAHEAYDDLSAVGVTWELNCRKSFHYAKNAKAVFDRYQLDAPKDICLNSYESACESRTEQSVITTPDEDTLTIGNASSRESDDPTKEDGPQANDISDSGDTPNAGGSGEGKDEDSMVRESEMKDSAVKDSTEDSQEGSKDDVKMCSREDLKIGSKEDLKIGSKEDLKIGSKEDLKIGHGRMDIKGDSVTGDRVKGMADVHGGPTPSVSPSSGNLSKGTNKVEKTSIGCKKCRSKK